MADLTTSNLSALTNEEEPMDFTLNIVAGTIVIVIAFIGLSINLNNFIIMTSLDDFRSSFGYLSRYRSFCNIYNLCFYLIFVGPASLGLFESNSDFGRWVGIGSSITYSCIPILQLGIAYNRVIAIFLPTHYNRLCSKTWAIIVIVFATIFGTISPSIDIFMNLRWVYFVEDLAWGYFEASRGLDEWIFNYPVLFFTFTTLALNIIIIIRIIVMRRSSNNGSSSAKQNKKLFWQGFIQEMFFLNDMMFYTYLGDISSTRAWGFVCYTFTAILAHTFDGLVFLILTPDLRKAGPFKIFSQLFRPRASPTHSDVHTI